MFERFVYVKLKEEWDNDAGRAAVVAEAGRVLPTVPGVLRCRAGVPAAEGLAKGWDICISLQFASLDEIESYRVHPDHQKFLDEFLSPRAEAKRVWNFETQEFTSES